MARKFVAGAAAYTGSTFALAIIWHIVLFEETYRALGYFGRDEPSFALGFMSIAVQGIILSAAYPLLVREVESWRENLRFFALMGGFLWTSHVAGDAAKFDISPVSQYAAMETFYLALQFGLFGLWIWLIHRPRSVRHAAATG